MSKLIAFRMPESLERRFAARIAERRLSATAALVAATALWLDQSPDAPETTLQPRPKPLRGTTAVVAARKKAASLPQRIVNRIRGFDALTGEPVE